MTPRPDPETVDRVARAISAAHPTLPNYKESLAGSEWRLRYENMATAAIGASGLLSLQRERDELMALIRECRLADAYAARTGEESRWDRAFRALCEAEHAALAHVENEGQ